MQAYDTPGAAALWPLLTAHQGETFYTMKKLPFTYRIKGRELFVDRRSKSITEATLLRAYERVKNDPEGKISGPKALNCFGAPYIWALFLALGIVNGAGSSPATADGGVFSGTAGGILTGTAGDGQSSGAATE